MRVIDQGILSHDPRRGAFMPSIAQLGDGSLIAVQHVGSGLAAPDNRIELLRSSDGRDWQNLGSIHRQNDDGWA
ncbi:MAG TPA: hypothetical protein VML55_00790, partial [Planctomycetaceae bacterium]|nr:hypothetical protein [Planctomycetaceae bacterium]